MTYSAFLASPLGGIRLASDGEALTGLWFDGQKFFPADLPEPGRADALPVFIETRRWLDLYFSGARPDFAPALRPAGTPFQHSVWALLLEIPYGRTVSYGALASRLGSSPRAVGGAVGRNPISLLIPCHRVLGADGSLTGYAGGTDRKRRLLRLERGEAVFDPNAPAGACILRDHPI